MPNTVDIINENVKPGATEFMYGAGKVTAGQSPSFFDTTGARLVGSWQLPTVASGAATVTLTAAQSGTGFLFDSAAGVTYTLPVPQVGLTFDFFVTVSVTSNQHKIITDTTTTFLQGLIMASASAAAASGFFGNGTTHRAVNMTGSTLGGLIGTHLSFYCITATQWQVDGFNAGSGSVATPFATS